MKLHGFLVAGTVIGLTATMATGASAQGLQHFAVLTGGNVVSATGKAAAGDPDGSGAAAVTIDDTGQVCVSLMVVKLDPSTTAAIRQGTAGVNGGIIIALTPPSGGNPGNSNTCTRTIAPSRLALLREKPNHFYIEIRSTAFPAGALRGQMF